MDKRFVKTSDKLPHKRIMAAVVSEDGMLHHCYYNPDMQIWTGAHIGEHSYHAYEIESWMEIQTREEYEILKENMK